MTYKIIRFRCEGLNRVIKTGLTLEEAKEHCSLKSTHNMKGKSNTWWFDGYEHD